MKTSAEGVRRIHAFEKFMPVAYLCPAGVPTIGYGTTRGVTHADVGKRAITQGEAIRLAALDLDVAESAVNRLYKVKPDQAQFDSMVSLTQNIGEGNFAGSSVLRAHNRSDFAAAGNAFKLFNKHRKYPGGPLVVSNGLTSRRAQEAAVYLSSLQASADEPMPQAVEPESKMSASPINRAGVVAGAGAAIASVTEITNALTALKTGVAGLGDWLVPALLVAVVLACGFVVWQRYLQRKGGWA